MTIDFEDLMSNFDVFTKQNYVTTTKFWEGLKNDFYHFGV